MNNHPVSFCLLFLSVELRNWLAIQRAKKNVNMISRLPIEKVVVGTEKE